MRQTFIKFDTDNSGSLSLSEFREAMAGKLAEDEVEEVFQVRTSTSKTIACVAPRIFSMAAWPHCGGLCGSSPAIFILIFC